MSELETEGSAGMTDKRHEIREVEAMLSLWPTPPRTMRHELESKYAGPNPYEKPDPKGDATIRMPDGSLSTPQTRAVRRARLAEAWEEGRKAFAASSPAA